MHTIIWEQPEDMQYNFIKIFKRNLTEFIADKKLNLRMMERMEFRNEMKKMEETTVIKKSKEIDLAYICFIQVNYQYNWDQLYVPPEEKWIYDEKIRIHQLFEANETLFIQSKFYNCTEENLNLLNFARLFLMWNSTESSSMVIYMCIHIFCFNRSFNRMFSYELLFSSIKGINLLVIL